MTVLVVIAGVIICSVIVKRSQRRREEKQRAAAAEWSRRQADIIKEQTRQAREQERLAREQMRQAAQLAKHEKRISDLEYRMEQAESDITHWKEQLGNLYGLLDIAEAEKAGAMPGSKTDERCQKRIVALTNQIHNAESRLRKAEHQRSSAARELTA